MTKCYPVINKFSSLHGDCSLKVDGIHVRVRLSYEDWKLVVPKKDFISCEYRNGNYHLIKIFKR